MHSVKRNWLLSKYLKCDDQTTLVYDPQIYFVVQKCLKPSCTSV